MQVSKEKKGIKLYIAGAEGVKGFLTLDKVKKHGIGYLSPINFETFCSIICLNKDFTVSPFILLKQDFNYTNWFSEVTTGESLWVRSCHSRDKIDADVFLDNDVSLEEATLS